MLVSSNTYVSNCLDPVSKKVMIVQSGFYDTLKWSMPIVPAQGLQVANAAYQELISSQSLAQIVRPSLIGDNILMQA